VETDLKTNLDKLEKRQVSGVFMRQRHGQNFLIDLNIANNIVKAADLSAQDEVLEIGPGKGVLTKLIQPKVKHLTAVEIDAELADALKKLFSDKNNIEIINSDFLDFGTQSFQPFKAVSNLPYNVGTAVIQKILPLPNWNICIFMLQKEVAARLAAKAGGKDYGYFSIFTQYYADSKLLFDVSPSCFNPAPKVMSSVIKLVNKRPPEPPKDFFNLIKRCFSMRRKTILNSLISFLNDKISAPPKLQALQILQSCKIDQMQRPDKLTIEDFLNLACQTQLKIEN
jgi:16S rRNA (adenine1518-N6/adenine1519-N6)-dimethyltransferase